MRGTVLGFVLALVAACGQGPESVLVVDLAQFDAGEIDPTLPAIEHTFAIENRTERDVTLRAVPSCACLKTDRKVYQIRAGGTGWRSRTLVSRL